MYIENKYQKYYFAYIQVSDNAGNWKNYYASDLGITDELDLIPSDYEEDKNPPVFNGVSYSAQR